MTHLRHWRRWEVIVMTFHLVLSHLSRLFIPLIWSDQILSHFISIYISSPSPFPSHLFNLISPLISSHLYHLYNLISPYHHLMSPHLISTFLISSFFLSQVYKENVYDHIDKCDWEGCWNGCGDCTYLLKIPLGTVVHLVISNNAGKQTALLRFQCSDVTQVLMHLSSPIFPLFIEQLVEINK